MKAEVYLSDLDAIVEHILSLCFYFDFISWSHVKRVGNFVAYHLAYLVPFGVQQIWSNHCPCNLTMYVMMAILSRH